MALRDRLAALLAPSAKASLIPLGTAEQPDVGLEKGINDAQLLSIYADDPWPYICASKVADEASQAPLRFGLLTPEGEWEAVPPDHPVQSLWDAPNPHTDGTDLLYTLMLYLDLVGHAPIEVSRPKVGAARLSSANRAGFELWSVQPGPWRIVAKPDGTIGGYRYEQDGRIVARWTAQQMTYLLWRNPNDRWYGQGRFQAVRQSIMAEEYAAQRDRLFEKRYGVPPGLISVKGAIGTASADEVQRRWEQMVGGYRNAGRVAVLGGEATYTEIALRAKDAQTIEHRRWRVQEIAAAEGIPLVLVLMSEATFANAREARRSLWEDRLQPSLGRIASMLSRRLVPLLTDEPLIARFDYSAIDALNENAKEVADRAVAWANTGSVKRGEVRDLLGLPPFADERDEDVLVPAELAVVKPIMGPAPAGAGELPAPPPEAARSRKARRAPRDRDVLLAPLRESWKRDLASFFTAQRGALNELRKALPEGTEGVLIRATEIIREVRFAERLGRISRGVLEAALAVGADAAAGVLEVPASFAIPASQEAVAAVDAQLVSLTRAVQGTTVDDVSRLISAALERGASNAELRAELDALFEGYQDWRLDRISRTETARAYASGSAGQYRSAGIAFVDIVDGDGDPACAEANGGRWTVEQYESDPLAHPNCTRVAIPVTEEPAIGEEEQPVAAVRGQIITLPAPIIRVEVPAPLVSLPPSPPIIVDTVAMSHAIDEMRGEMRKALRPRRRRVLRDEKGRITGLEE